MGDFNLSGILEEMTVEDIKTLKPNVGIIPIGSTEPHGPALPYGTDTFSTEERCYAATREANGKGAKVVCLPTQKISLNNNFYGLPFSCRISVPVFMSMVRDLVFFLMEEGINRVLIANGHGGNTDVLKAVQRDLAGERKLFLGLIGPGIALPKQPPSKSGKPSGIYALIEHPSPHAGEWETSNMLFLKPGLVKEEKIGVNPLNLPALEALEKHGVHFVKPWHLFVPASAGGDSRKATAEKGRILFEAGVKSWVELFVELSTAAESENFPF